MKKLWKILFIVGVIFTMFIGTYSFVLKENDSLIFDESFIFKVTVKDAVSNNSNQKILEDLDNFAVNNVINIYRITESFDSGAEVQKEIYLANGNNQLAMEYLNLKDESVLENDFNLTNEDMLFFNNNRRIIVSEFKNSIANGIGGYYYFQGDIDKISLIKEELNNLNLDYEERGINRNVLSYVSIFLGIIYIPGGSAILVSIFLFLLTFIFLSFFEMFIRFKEISIYKMLGYSKFGIINKILIPKFKFMFLWSFIGIIILAMYDIVFKDSIKLIEYLSFSSVYFIGYLVISILIIFLSLLSIGIVKIKETIKGKKNIKFIRRANYVSLCFLTLIVMVFTNNIINASVSLSHQINDLEKYSVYKDYVFTRVSASAFELNQEERLKMDANIKLGLDSFTNKYSDKLVLFEPSNYFNSSFQTCSNLNNDYSCNVPIITVNSNYLRDIQPIVDVSLIKTSSSDINVLVPNGLYNNHLDEILLDASKYNYSPTNSELLNVNKIDYDGINVPIIQKINDYDKESVNDPIVIVLNENNLKENNNNLRYYSYGNMFINVGSSTKGYSVLEPMLKEFNIENNIRTVTNVYSLVLENINSLKSELFYYVFALIIMIIIYINMIYFATITYIEENKKMLSIKNVLGYGLYDLFRIFIFTNIIICCLSLFMYIIIFGFSINDIYIVILELLIVLLGIKLKGKQSIIKNIKEG